jgi:GntR family transcriptional regulator/MocR family aminotransferase
LNIVFNAKENPEKPLYKRIVECLIDAIETGRLPYGAVLPSSRDLADSFSVSRDTIVKCYRELQRLSYVATNATKGTYVIARTTTSANLGSAIQPGFFDQKRLSTYGQNLARICESETYTADFADFAAFNYGAVPKSALPMKRWREIMQQQCVPETLRNLQYEPDILGRVELRQALTGYLDRRKGLKCTVGELAIFSISLAATNLVCRLLLDPGDTVAIEEPGYAGIKKLAATQGLKLYPVEVDSEGLVVEALKQSKQRIKLVYVTPNHHEPLGVTMSLSRRKELLAWAQAEGAWIIEDDYDGNFHYAGMQPTSLRGLESSENVIYLYTFWQILYPLTSISFCVIPEKLAPLFAAAKVQTEGLSEAIVQLTLAQIIDEGYLERHCRKIQKAFNVRRIALTQFLKRSLGQDIIIRDQCAGNHLIAYLHKWPEREVLAAAAAAKLPLISTRSFYLQSASQGEFVINFACLHDDQIKAIVSSFVDRLRG